jgi:hypothetical protein
VSAVWPHNDRAELEQENVRPGAEERKMEQKQLVQLRRILWTHFNVSELRDLCFDLGVDYEDLPDQTKRDLAREIVVHCKRHGRIPELIEIGKRLRPQVSWDDLFKVTKRTSSTLQSSLSEWSAETWSRIPPSEPVAPPRPKPWWVWGGAVFLLGVAVTWVVRTLLYLQLRSDPTYEYVQAVDYSNFLAVAVGLVWLGLTIFVTYRGWQRK